MTRARDRTTAGFANGPRLVLLSALRRRIRALETPSTEGEDGAARRLRFGVPAIDNGLPWGGLALGGVHEIIEAEDSAGGGAALGFCAALLARLSAAGGAVLWCQRGSSAGRGELYAPGLAGFGLDPSRLILVRARNDDDLLWAMQEGLRCGRLAAVVGEPRKLGLSKARRLQLAAESRGVPGFLLRAPGARREPSTALSRWRLAALPGEASSLSSLASSPSPSPAERPRWRAELLRARGGSPNVWFMEWCHETHNFSLAAPLCDRPAEPAARRLAV